MEEVMKIRLDNKWSQTIFNITPIMSTYLLAFTVSDFKPISTTGPNNLKVLLHYIFLNSILILFLVIVKKIEKN